MNLSISLSTRIWLVEKSSSVTLLLNSTAVFLSLIKLSLKEENISLNSIWSSKALLLSVWGRRILTNTSNYTPLIILVITRSYLVSEQVKFISLLSKVPPLLSASRKRTYLRLSTLSLMPSNYSYREPISEELNSAELRSNSSMKLMCLRTLKKIKRK